MKNFYIAFVAMLLLAVMPAMAQLVATSPSPLQEASKDVVLTYYADSPLGNMGLANLAAGFDVYAHIGVITSKSTGPGDWRYVVTPWPEAGNSQLANTSKNRLNKIAANTYTLAIGDIRSYFGITDASETVKEIVAVFRTADGRKEGKTSDGSDIRIPVVEAGFQIEFTCDAENTILTGATTIKFAVTSTQVADLSIAVAGSDIASAKGVKTLEGEYTFTSTGDYDVTATAKSGSETRTQTINIAYPGQSEQEPYPGGVPKMGAVKNADGTVTFCLAAPGKSSVMLVPSWDDYAYYERNQMKRYDYQGNTYFWLTVSGLADDQWYPYYYVVDGRYRVADPYAHLVLDCYNDSYIDPSVWPDMPKYPLDKVTGVMLAVYRGDIDDYDFASFEIPDHKNLIIYEMLFRDFTGSNGVAEGNGTVRKAIEKIPYIKAMGFNAVELMPIMEFNGNNSWGYNTNFYMAPDKAYGSPTDYKDFIDECHRQGMAVILDIVFNQSDGLHPWYMMYPASSNPFYNRTAPHEYSVLNDWNQDNALVQQQWTDALKYWMTAYNVDGYRFDLVKGLGDNDSYVAAGGTNQYNKSRVERMKRLHSVIKSVKPNGLHINENLAGAEEEIAMGEDGEIQWVNVNNSSCQYTMGYSSDCDLKIFLATAYGNRPAFSTVSYAESHDEQRMGYKNAAYGVEAVQGESLDSYRRLGSLAVQMLLTPGPKMVWQFGELGNSQNTKNPDGGNNTDPKIVDWNWLDNPDRHNLMETYASIIQLRRDYPELFGPDAKFTPNFSTDFATKTTTIRIEKDGRYILAFINPAVGGEPVDVKLYVPSVKVENLRLHKASPGFEPEISLKSRNLTVAVPPHCFAVYTTDNMSGIDDVPAGASDVRIIAEGGRIVVLGDYNSVEVHDLAGRRVPAEGLSSGIYIVTVDGRSTKIAL